MNVHFRLLLQSGNVESFTSVITSIIASVEMVSGAHRRDIQVSNCSSTNGLLIMDMCFKGPSAMENVCCLGEHVRSFDSRMLFSIVIYLVLALHNLPELRNLYSGASMHILSPSIVTESTENSKRGPVRTDARTGVRRSCRKLEQCSLEQVSLLRLHLPAVNHNDAWSDINGITDTDLAENVYRASASVKEVFTRTWCDVAVQCGEAAQPFNDPIAVLKNGTMTLNRTGYVILRPTCPKIRQCNPRKLMATFTPLIVIVCDPSHMKMESGTVSTGPAVTSATLTTFRLPNVNIDPPRRCFRIQTTREVQIHQAQNGSLCNNCVVPASQLRIVGTEITCYEGLRGSTTTTDDSIRRTEEGGYDRERPIRDREFPRMQSVFPNESFQIAEKSQSLTEIDQPRVITIDRFLGIKPVDDFNPEASCDVSEDPLLFVVRKKATDLWGN